MILAAGLGTRLMPLTAQIPKALVSINGITLLEIAIHKLAREGFNEIIINVHHHPDKVLDFLAKKTVKDVRLAISDEKEQLLDTGGAIQKARWFLDGNEPFLVHNVDVISNISLKSLLASHRDKQSLATLSVINRKTRRYFLFDNDLKLKGWTDTSSSATRWASEPTPGTRPLAFSGIHILDPGIFSLMEDTGRFSIIDTYLKLAGQNAIHGHIQNDCTWFDLGKPEQVDLVSAYVNNHPELIEMP